MLQSLETPCQSPTQANAARPRVAMIQDGARRRYMVPLGLDKAGLLERVYIDWFAPRGSPEAVFSRLVGKLNPALGQRMAERACPELNSANVIRNPALALKLRLKMPRFPTSEDSFIWASRGTAQWIIRRGFGQANILYGFIRNAAPEAFRVAHARGLRTCGDQIIAPLRVEAAEMDEQQRRWPGWSDAEAASLHQEYLRFEEQTWQELDQITCMSDYVRDGLVSVGVAPEKITVIPYPWTPEQGVGVQRDRRSGPLRVGFVGTVGLRKGAPYFLEVARRFDPRRVKFFMVGAVLLHPDKLRPYQDHVEFIGSVPRSKVKDWLDRFDVFFFPSTCEGSAGAVMEAMAGALPVLTTFNSGSQARDGIDGMIRRYDDIDGFAQAITQLDDDRDLLRRMGDSARQRVLSYGLDAYGQDLLNCFTRLLKSPESSPRPQLSSQPPKHRAPASGHQWIISQIGARQHYGVPRGFEAAGQLKRLYTDAWCPRIPRRLLLHGNAPMRAFATRWHAEIPPAKVVSHNLRAVGDAIRRSWNSSPTVEQIHLEHLRIGRHFDQCVVDDLCRRGRLEPGRDAFFGFNTGCLETLRMLRQRGVPTVVDQIDPARVEEEIVFAEAAKWPGWQEMPGRVPQAYWDHMAAEWAAADLLLVNSNWTKSALVRQGVPIDKIRVAPQAYEPDIGPVPLPRRDRRPLTVLWLGNVILRKGIQYLIEAAKLLADRHIRFLVAGSIGITKQALATAPPSMTFMGRLTLDQTDEVYRQSDVFVLPTLSDGFAATQVEAMSKGLPVIATPNCGEVVTHGQDGWIIPVGDAAALADAIARLDQDRDLLAEMSHKAFIHSTRFLLPNQARQVEAAVLKLEADRAL